MVGFDRRGEGGGFVTWCSPVLWLLYSRLGYMRFGGGDKSRLFSFREMNWFCKNVQTKVGDEPFNLDLILII